MIVSDLMVGPATRKWIGKHFETFLGSLPPKASRGARPELAGGFLG